MNREIDLESAVNIPLSVQNQFSFNSSVSSAGNQIVTEEVLNHSLSELELCMRQAQLDLLEADAMILELKSSRKYLQKSKEKSDHVIRRQMKCKKEALRLHKRYLEYALELHGKFKGHYTEGLNPEDREDLRDLTRVICQVLTTSHTRIQEALAMPLEDAAAYCRSVKIRMGGALRFFQKNPGVAGASTFGLGIVAAAGLTFVLGPFGALIAVAVTVSAYTYMFENSSHEYSKTFKMLNKCTKQMNSKRIQRNESRVKLQNRISATVTQNTTAIPSTSSVRTIPISHKEASAPFGGSSEVD